VGLVEENGRAWQFVKLPKLRGRAACESLEELYARRDYNGCSPQDSDVPIESAAEIGSVVMRYHHVLPVLFGEAQCISKNTNRLVYDIRVGSYDEETAKLPFEGRPQEKCGDRGGFAQAHWSLATGQRLGNIGGACRPIKV
jgi:hypothetical protein